MTGFKNIVATLYLKNGQAVKSASDMTVMGDVYNLCQLYNDSGIDKIIIFDLSTDDDEKKKKFTELFELYKQKSAHHKLVTEKFEELKTSRFNQEQINIVVKGAAYPGAVIKYRRQVEKISVMQSAFMMSFLPGQESAPMTAINTKKK
mgnify:CR=1 FL=1